MDVYVANYIDRPSWELACEDPETDMSMEELSTPNLLGVYQELDERTIIGIRETVEQDVTEFLFDDLPEDQRPVLAWRESEWDNQVPPRRSSVVWRLIDAKTDPDEDPLAVVTIVKMELR